MKAAELEWALSNVNELAVMQAKEIERLKAENQKYRGALEYGIRPNSVTDDFLKSWRVIARRALSEDEK